MQDYCVCVDPLCDEMPKFFITPKDTLKHSDHQAYIKSFEEIHKNFMGREDIMNGLTQNFDLNAELKDTEQALMRIQNTFLTTLVEFGCKIIKCVQDNHEEVKRRQEFFKAIQTENKELSQFKGDLNSFLDFTEYSTIIEKISKDKIQNALEINHIESNIKNIFDCNHSNLKVPIEKLLNNESNIEWQPSDQSSRDQIILPYTQYFKFIFQSSKKLEVNSHASGISSEVLQNISQIVYDMKPLNLELRTKYFDAIIQLIEILSFRVQNLQRLYVKISNQLPFYQILNPIKQVIQSRLIIQKTQQTQLIQEYLSSNKKSTVQFIVKTKLVISNR